ncbi:hypothetical protein C5167_005876 [Papaver somniferum]|uniref:Uncharacterized protein n=1 Tax=Papaver somniferum TaxID=3469 RepID=A0A4Y7JF01_PAPSO|nr:hypothetical protein C5167_005876 [Papaver somniferum]
MESLSPVSTSIVIQPNNPLFRFQRQRQTRIFHSLSFPRKNTHFFTTRRTRDTCSFAVSGNNSSGGGSEEKEEEDLETALHLDGSIPSTSDEFVKQVSSRAYDMRRHLHQTFDTSSYDVLEANPWRGASKPVYVLTQRENQLCTMKTRTNRSEVEKELGLLFSKKEKSRSENKTKQSRNGTNFRMVVEDVREGVLAYRCNTALDSCTVRSSSPKYLLLQVFEDENDAAKYCDLLQGGGQGCEDVVEIDASSVFDICQKMRALAVLFRRGRTPPLPESLQLNLKAKKRSLEDQEDLI